MKSAEFKDKREYVKDLIMGAMADDYESYEIIIGCITGFAAEAGETLDLAEIPGLLKELIEKGNVDAFELSSFAPHAVVVPFSHDRLDELWYYLSPKGMLEYKARHNIIW